MNNSYVIDTGSLYMDGYDMMSETETSTGTEFSMNGLLSNWFFVGGVSAGTLLLSIVIGLLLAQSKIKKGFDVYED